MFANKILNMGRILSCDQCDYKTEKRTNLSNHLFVLHSDTKFTCPECGFQTSWKNSLTLHTKSLHEGKKYPCESCDYQATTNGSLKTHQQSVHKGKKYSSKSYAICIRIFFFLYLFDYQIALNVQCVLTDIKLTFTI